MISVSKYDLRVDLMPQFVLMNSLHTAHSADRHEYRCRYVAMVSVQYAGSGFSVFVSLLEVEMHLQVVSYVDKLFLK